MGLVCTCARVSGRGKAWAQEPGEGGAERGQGLQSAEEVALNVLDIAKAYALWTQRAALESLLNNDAKARARPRLGGRVCDMQARLDTRAGARWSQARGRATAAGWWWEPRHLWALFSTPNASYNHPAAACSEPAALGGHGGTETVSGVSGQALPGQEEERDSGDTGSERPGSAAAPAGTCWPGRPQGRGPAPESRPGPCPGPEAAPGCFWVWAPLHCLQEEGVSAPSPRPVSTGTTRTGPASPGPPPEGRAGMRAVQGLGQEPRRRPAATISLGLGWAGTSPRGQGGGEQGVERLASGRSSLVLHLHQVSHVICEAAAAVNTMDRAGAPPLGPPAGAGVLGTPPKGVLMPGWLDGQGRPGLS